MFDSTQKDRNSLINYGLLTIWEQVDIYLSNTMVSQSSNAYPFRVCVEVLTKYDKKSHHTFLRSAGCCPYGPLDPDIVDVDLTKVCDESKKFKLYVKLVGDILNPDRLLINGESVKIVLDRSKDTFALM
jgi:hypothetical protein